MEKDNECSKDPISVSTTDTLQQQQQNVQMIHVHVAGDGPISVSTTNTLQLQQQNVQMIHVHVAGDVGEINIHEAENLMVNTGGGQGVMHVKSVQANEGTDLQLSDSEETLIYEKEQIEPDEETSYLHEGTDLQLSDSEETLIYEKEQIEPDEETSYLHEENETVLIERFKEMQDVFVETERYKKALHILLENNFEVITGLSGEGKTFLAMKLIYDLTQKGLSFKEITTHTAFHDFECCENTVFLIDDAFQIDNPDLQWRIVEIQNFIKSNIFNKKNNFLIMTSRKDPFVSVKDRMNQYWLLDGAYIIDFTEVGLSMGEKHDIILKHINRFQPKENLDGIDKMKIAKEVAEVTCQGFANCAYFFVRNKKWFNKGLDFFLDPIKTIRDDVDSLRELDPKKYMFLLYLLLKGGRIRGTTLDTCGSDNEVISLLQKIKYFPKEEYCAILNDALHQVEYVYVSRVDSIGTYTFRHDYIVEAVCISFSKILPREAFMNVPFDFISTRIRIDDCNADIPDRIILYPDRYNDLATRFIRELTIGNIRSICEHPASFNAKFSKIFVSKLHSDTQSQFLIQITESEDRSTINGSLLYWSASCGAEHLCMCILESELYSNVKDKFWLQTQASAALTSSCWFGFNMKIIDGLLNLGADMNSSIHPERRFQTYTSDCLAVHDQYGWTPVQLAVGGTNRDKKRYIEELMKRGFHFEGKKMDIQLPWLVDANEFRRMLSNGTFLSYENRLSLAGPCKSGKSTLASVLIGEEIPLKWNSTDGLIIYFGRNGIDIEKKKMVSLQEGERRQDILAKILRGKPAVYNKLEREAVEQTTKDASRNTLKSQSVNSSPQSLPENMPIRNKNNKTSTDDDAIQTYDFHTESDVKHKRAQLSGKCISPVTDKIQTLECQKLQLHSEILDEVRNGTYQIEIAPSDLIDFGGQKSYDMTHQLFIQHKGSFLLMFDGRFGLHNQLDEYPKGVTAMSILKHWVDSILTYTADTDEIMPIIMFAATHRDMCGEDTTEMRNSFIADLKKTFSEHEKKSHIHLDTLYFINGVDKNDHEIQRMTNQVVIFAMRQSSWGQRQPMQWVPLELQISNLRMKNINILTKENLQEVNKLNANLALNEHQMEDFLLIQHSLGRLMYYNSPGLDQFIIIHPPALVNILRSFVTNEQFWPTDTDRRYILEKMTKTGKIYKKGLLQLWEQHQFNQYMPDEATKEFVIQLLVHLDILVVPKALKQFSTDVYLVPCMIKAIKPDFNNLGHKRDNTICLEYVANNSIPSSLAYKVIGAACIIWPLKEENKKTCLYHKAAVLNVTEDDELRIWVDDNRIKVNLTNQKSLLSLSPDIVASIQECLTKNIESSLLFYYKSFGKKIKITNVLELFKFAVGIPCDNDVCFTSVEEVKQLDHWKCDKGKTHDTRYLRYWTFNKSQKMCAPGCKGLNHEELGTKPSDKHLVRLGCQIGINSFHELFKKLGMSTLVWENLVDMYGGHSREGIMSMALAKWKTHKISNLEKPTLYDLSDALTAANLDKHAICKLFREETKLLEIADFKLQEIPSNDVLKELSQRIGNCALQLGIELGLSFNDVEESFVRFPKDLYGLVEDVLNKWKATSKVKTIHSLMMALQRVRGGGLDYLYQMSK